MCPPRVAPRSHVSLDDDLHECLAARCSVVCYRRRGCGNRRGARSPWPALPDVEGGYHLTGVLSAEEQLSDFGPHRFAGPGDMLTAGRLGELLRRRRVMPIRFAMFTVTAI